MELLQLKYFVHAAETENFSHTAKFFGVPPSTVSQTVKRLEDELGASLFDRSKNTLTLNENGRNFKREISAALTHISTALDLLKSREECTSGEIRLLVLADRRIVAKKISEFKAKYPSISFLIEHSAPQNDYHNFDLIIGEGSPDFEGFSKTLYLKEHILLALSKKNPLSKKEELSVSDLKESDFITMPMGNSLYRITNIACGSAGFKPNIVIKCDDLFYLRQYVDMDFGVAFVPEFSQAGQFGENTVLKHLSDFSFVRETFIYHSPRRQIGRAASAFKDFLLK